MKYYQKNKPIPIFIVHNNFVFFIYLYIIAQTMTHTVQHSYRYCQIDFIHKGITRILFA